MTGRQEVKYITVQITKIRDSLDYFGRVKGKHRMHENTEKLLEELLTMLSEKGEEETFAYIMKIKKNQKIISL